MKSKVDGASYKKRSGANFVFFLRNIALKIKEELIEAKPNKLLIYKGKSLIPAYLFLSFKPAKTGTIVTHSLKIGYKGIFGKIIDWFTRKFYLTKAFEKALEKHAKEEFKNLEELA